MAKEAGMEKKTCSRGSKVEKDRNAPQNLILKIHVTLFAKEKCAILLLLAVPFHGDDVFFGNFQQRIYDFL